MGEITVDIADILTEISPHGAGDALPVYKELLALDIPAAFESSEPAPRVGLEAAASIVENYCRGSLGQYPDLVFVESSLFSERIRSGDPLRDFVLLRIREPDAAARSSLYKAAAEAYERVYDALHDHEMTVYYLHGFFAGAARMRMPWSEYTFDPNSSSSDRDDSTHDDKVKKRIAAVRAAVRRSTPVDLSSWHVKTTSGDGGVADWYRVNNLSSVNLEERVEWTSRGEMDLFRNVALFHETFHECGLRNYPRSYLCCVPLLGGTPQSDSIVSHLGGMGAVFVIAAFKDPTVKLGQATMTSMGRSLSYLMKDVFGPFSYASARENLRKSQRHARRSAVAAIIGRNMSHNIGSHVLANITASALGKHPEQGAALLQYLQRRMDFIAQVATSGPSWSVGMYAEDLVREFTDNVMLLDNIARFVGVDVRGIQFRFATGGDAWEVWEGGVTARARSVDRWAQLRVDVAHGTVGAHAFYSILENVLRNAAKHGDRQYIRQVSDPDGVSKPLTGDAAAPKIRLSFRFFSEPDPMDSMLRDHFKLVVTDDVPTSRYTSSAGGAGQSAGREDTAEYLTRCINAEIIDPKTGELAPGGWGLKEIRVGAYFLRLLDIAKEDTPQTPAVTVAWTDASEDVSPESLRSFGYLGFTLYLPKSKIGLLVGTAVDLTDHEAWRVEGFDFLDDVNALMQGIKRGDVYRHEFVVIDERALRRGDLDAILRVRGRLPTRIVIGGAAALSRESPEAAAAVEQISPPQAGEEPRRFATRLWETWARQRYPDHYIVVHWPKQFDDELAWPSWVSFVSEAGVPLALPPPKRSLAFDHGAGARDDSRRTEGLSYHHAISGGVGIGNLLLYSQGDAGILAELLESAAGRVALLDERLFPHGSDPLGVELEARAKCPSSWTISDAWRSRRVVLLDHQRAFADFAEFVGLLPEMLRFGGDHVHGKVCDFFVVHQGVLDELQRRFPRHFEESWRRLKTMTRFMIIDTGRGVPSVASRDGLPWVEYSNLETFVLRRPGDKLALWRLLNSLRASSTLATEASH